MKYIDKSLDKQKGEQVVTEFLDCFYKRTGTYPDDMYLVQRLMMHMGMSSFAKGL